MIRTLQRGLNVMLYFIFLFISFSCSSVDSHLNITHIESCRIDNYNPNFREFSSPKNTSSHEYLAVLNTFAGAYREALSEATLDQSVFDTNSMTFGLDSVQRSLFLDQIKLELKVVENLQQRQEMQTYAEVLGRPQNLDSLFSDKHTLPAIDYIVQHCKGFHFSLINEAHYSSQNREFTRTLLRPMWKAGYRYLALETLAEDDVDLPLRRFPILKSGYYIQDPVFGNMVREAIKIGYTLIPYEFSSQDENLRDSMQARNIFQRTYKMDTIGKVLVHAGYSHIYEKGDRKYRPMGSQLKKLADKEVLTIDQVTMLGLNDDKRFHPYYTQAVKRFSFEHPVVVVDKNSKSLIDPISAMGIDIQVYHPVTKFINDRPNWLLTNETKIYDVPTSLQKFRGSLLQLANLNDSDEAIAVDQTIIKNKSTIILVPGKYSFRIIDEEGAMIARGRLEAL